jgi:hypothetical protein
MPNPMKVIKALALIVTVALLGLSSCAYKTCPTYAQKAPAKAVAKY